MKKILKVRIRIDAWIFLLLLFMLSNCEKEKITAREYPRLRTQEVDHITEEGAMFHAEITYRGDYGITRYGFVWSSDVDPKLENAEKIEYSTDLEENSFSASITTSLIEDQTYMVRSFLETAEYTVYGDMVEFISLGSQAPQILEYEPALGTWGDTITVIGENFSFLPGTNMGYLGEVQLMTVFDSDTLLRFEIPPIPNTEEVQLSVELSGNRAIAEETFSYIRPEILGLERLEASYGDTIRIDVIDCNKDYLDVRFNEISAQIISFNEMAIEVSVPSSLEETDPVIVVESAGFTDQISGFTLNTPSFIFEGSYTSYFGDTIVIEGTNLNPDISFNSVSFGPYSGEVLEATATAIQFLVPEELDILSSELQVQSGSFAFDAGNFELLLPEINSILPEEISHPDDQIEINGQGFNTSHEYVTITLTHPNGNYVVSPSEVSMMSKEQILLTLNQEQVFRYLSISVIGELSVEIQTHALDPASMYTEIQYQSTWTRKQDFPGPRRQNAVAFSMDNQGYYGTGTDGEIQKVYNDFWTYDPSADTWIQIEDFPGEPRRDAIGLTISGEGYVGLGSNYYTAWADAEYYSDFYKYDPMGGWERQADFAGPGTTMAASFSINNMAYVSTGQYWNDDPVYYNRTISNDTWVYDALLDQWNQAVDFPTTTNVAVGFSVGDSGYIYNHNELYVLRDNNWSQIPSPSLDEEGLVGFSLGDLAYFGFGNSHGTKQNNLSEYNPQTYTWSIKSLEGEHPRAYASAFVIGNKGYIVGGSYTREVWEFDPSKPDL